MPTHNLCIYDASSNTKSQQVFNQKHQENSRASMPFRKLAAVLLWLGVALAARLPAVGALPPPSSSCQRKCGDVDIPYPFGIEPESPDHCAMPGFFLSCDGTAGNNVSKPFYGDVEVLDISLQHGQARVMNQISSYCYNTASQTMDLSPWELNLTGTPYRLSNTGNKFTVIGCRTLAYIGDEDNVGKYMSGCVAMCRRGNVTNLTDGSCSGIGCCQTGIPSGLQYYQVWFDSSFNTTEIYNISRCSYAVLMDSSNFTFSTSYVTSSEFNTNDGGRAPLVLDWAIGDETCEVARKKQESYACVSSNSECFNSPNGLGYICNCSKGFQGNPYLQDPDHGCRDINECTEGEYPCSVAGTCHNIPGGFKCSCPQGYPKGNAQNGTCERDQSHQTLQLREKLAIGAFACVLVGLTGFLGREVLLHKRSIKRQALLRQRDENFQQNGGQILSEIMKAEGYIQLTLYDREQIELATNGFDKANIVGEGGQGTVYKAILDNNAVAIKRCKEVDESRRMDFVQELVILCRVNHPNIVKLLGCCLQFEAPMLVYEFVQNKTLQELLHYQRNKRCRVTLGTRLRIAAESTEALAHLHSLPHPILHGDVKPANILLGEGWVAKVSDFGCSTIDEKTQAVPKGTPGYLDPDYLLEYQLTDKNDVYSFGVVLLELLTGKNPLSKERKSLTLMFQESMGDGTLHELLDSDIVDEASMGVIRQVAVLASQCLVIPGTRRPAMSRVAEELRRLADQVQQQPQTPLVLEALSQAEMGCSTSSGYTESETTGFYSLEKKAALSIEFAR